MSLKKLLIILPIAVVAFAAYKYFVPTPIEKAVSQLQFDNSVSDAEKTTILDAIKNQSKTYTGSITVTVKTTPEPTNNPHILSAHIPVTNKYSTKQAITKTELSQAPISVSSDIDGKAKAGIANSLSVDMSNLVELAGSLEEIPPEGVALVPASKLSPSVKLLSLDDAYYLDNFQKGAIFRQAEFTGDSAASLADLHLNNLETKETTLKVNMTGVTALTREMMKKLSLVKDAKYFSEKIGSFLADADITHVSNEVSFKTGCTYSASVFCSPPEMIETLKDSGVDLVELTGNHNNDTGKQYNTETINLYRSLGMSTVGGGLNNDDAAKPFIADKKQSKIAFLGYNYPDSPNGGAIATASGAGANSFSFDKIKSDIESAKRQSSFVIVDVQFWECYSYPDGYVEFPECDKPIGTQEETFRKIADLGADMVIGTQAHQTQTYETYKGKPIYYGLGNLYFDQVGWPGTERGLILTHYFVKGKLVQTKLSPTVYNKELQTHLMTNTEAVKLLERLKTARASL